MGQAKHNPTAMAAKRGELPPKRRGPSKREMEREMQRRMVLRFPLLRYIPGVFYD